MWGNAARDVITLRKASEEIHVPEFIMGGGKNKISCFKLFMAYVSEALFIVNEERIVNFVLSNVSDPQKLLTNWFVLPFPKELHKSKGVNFQ